MIQQIMLGNSGKANSDIVSAIIAHIGIRHLNFHVHFYIIST